MVNPGVTPSLFAATIDHLPSLEGALSDPGPRTSSSMLMRLRPCRLLYQRLSGTSPRVFTAPAGTGDLRSCFAPGFANVMKKKS
jgi:hypothetical protein